MTLCIGELVGAIEYTDCTSAEGLNPREFPDMTLNSNAVALGNTEYPFIAIAAGSILSPCVITW